MVADYIGSDHTEVIISEKDVLEALPAVVELLATWDITTVRASVGMGICRRCSWFSISSAPMTACPETGTESRNTSGLSQSFSTAGFAIHRICTRSP